MKAIRFRTKIVGAFAVGLIVVAAACGGASSTSEPAPTLTPSTDTPEPTTAPTPSTATPEPTPTLTPSTDTPESTPTLTPSTGTPESTTAPTPLENRPPTAVFTFDPPSVARGDNFETVVTYTATGSDPDGDPLTYEWSFMGGRPATASGSIATTTFPGVRPYASTLTVSDGKGGTVTITKIVPLG